jgi:hypothetical protein
MATVDRSEGESAKRFRSPPYPQITLGKAIERARELHSKVRQNAVGSTVLASAWGYSESSGGIWTTAAALLQFGLLYDEGSGEKRKFQLTEPAIRILLDPDPTSLKRMAALQDAALAPKIHAELWEKYGPANGLDDVVIKTYLTLDRRDEGKAPFSDTSADEVIKVYRDAIAVASLAEGASITAQDEARPQQRPERPEATDKVTTAQLTQAAHSPAGGHAHRPQPVALGEGERQLTAGLLSRDASFRLVVSGRIGVKEIERLIQKLEIDKEILADPETDDAH